MVNLLHIKVAVNNSALTIVVVRYDGIDVSLDELLAVVVIVCWMNAAGDRHFLAVYYIAKLRIKQLAQGIVFQGKFKQFPPLAFGLVLNIEVFPHPCCSLWVAELETEQVLAHTRILEQLIGISHDPKIHHLYQIQDLSLVPQHHDLDQELCFVVQRLFVLALDFRVRPED